MNPNVLTSFGAPDPTAAPLNLTELVALLNTLVSSAIQGEYIPYVISSDTPSVDDQDKAWIEKDTGGRPISVKIFYNGNWRRVYNGMIGEVRGYTGDPTIDFDVLGRGLVGGRYDGWQIMNGNYGTADLSDKFVIGAHMNNLNGHVGYSSGWQTFVDETSDLKTGGAKDHLVVPDDLPALDNSNAGTGEDPGLYIHGNEYKEDADHTPDAAVLIDVHYANLITHSIKLLELTYGNSGTQDAVPTLPPFYALAWITFLGYI